MSMKELQSETPRAIPSISIRSIRLKAAASETVEMVGQTAREALFAYAMTGSLLASVAIMVAPHFEMLLRCAFHGRG